MEIKGYKLIRFPLDGSEVFHNMFMKEHKQRSQTSENKPILFVCNVSTCQTGYKIEQLKIYVKSLFSKFGGIDNVSVGTPASEQEKYCRPLFAHIVFEKRAGLKKALQASQFDKEDVDEALQAAGRPSIGLQALIEQHRQSQSTLEALEEQANIFMKEFEAKEEMEKKDRQELMNKVDEDGFTLVTYKKPSTKRGREEGNDNTGPGNKRGGGKSRTRNKKKVELKNFYRFQMREEKRNQLLELRKRFEEDKRKIETLKAARKFKPF